MNPGVKIFAPATVANVSVGYDIMGFAIDNMGDEVIAREGTGKGIQIKRITGDGKKLPRDPMKNTASYSAYKLLEFLGEPDFPLEMEITKRMPLCSGLGSSAASAVAGVVAANYIIGSKLSKEELLKFAVMGEELVDQAWHADNIAPSLFGNWILIRDNASLDIVHLPVPRGIYVVIIHPHILIKTIDSRRVVPKQIELSQHITQAGNLASFVSSMYSNDFKLMKRALHDNIIEPHRASLIPHFEILKEMCLVNDALGFGISGAGPSMFCLCTSTIIAERIQERVEAFYELKMEECDIFITKINRTGAFKH